MARSLTEVEYETPEYFDASRAVKVQQIIDWNDPELQSALRGALRLKPNEIISKLVITPQTLRAITLKGT
jgi:hypothetical protein